MQSPDKEKFSLSARIKSFQYAIAGLKTAFSKEHNMWLHLLAALLVLILGGLLSVSKTDWICLLFCIGMVISFELINTALEKLCDLVSLEFSPLIRQIKDLAAAAVLVAAIISLLVGLIIFLPFFIRFLS